MTADDGPLVYYQLTLWAFGSGQLENDADGVANSVDPDQIWVCTICQDPSVCPKN